MRGPMIGATAEGYIDYLREEVRMRGTFVPFFGLNNMFGQIPVFGLFLGGGSNEGLVGLTYEVVGPPGSPVLRVNPISVVTPGLLRKFFEFPTSRLAASSASSLGAELARIQVGLGKVSPKLLDTLACVTLRIACLFLTLCFLRCPRPHKPTMSCAPFSSRATLQELNSLLLLGAQEPKACSRCCYLSAGELLRLRNGKISAPPKTATHFLYTNL